MLVNFVLYMQKFVTKADANRNYDLNVEDLSGN